MKNHVMYLLLMIYNPLILQFCHIDESLTCQKIKRDSVANQVIEAGMYVRVAPEAWGVGCSVDGSGPSRPVLEATSLTRASLDFR